MHLLEGSFPRDRRDRRGGWTHAIGAGPISRAELEVPKDWRPQEDRRKPGAEGRGEVPPPHQDSYPFPAALLRLTCLAPSLPSSNHGTSISSHHTSLALFVSVVGARTVSVLQMSGMSGNWDLASFLHRPSLRWIRSTDTRNNEDPSPKLILPICFAHHRQARSGASIIPNNHVRCV